MEIEACEINGQITAPLLSKEPFFFSLHPSAILGFHSSSMDEAIKPSPHVDHDSLVASATDPDDDTSSTVLDLTSFQLHDLSSVEFPPILIELDLTANRLSSLDTRIGILRNLKKLSLRQNLIDDAGVDPISNWDALSGLEVFNFSLKSQLL